jgi:hypothetical protein
MAPRTSVDVRSWSGAILVRGGVHRCDRHAVPTERGTDKRYLQCSLRFAMSMVDEPRAAARVDFRQVWGLVRRTD